MFPVLTPPSRLGRRAPPPRTRAPPPGSQGQSQTPAGSSTRSSVYKNKKNNGIRTSDTILIMF